MRVTVKLIATYRTLLPEGTQGNKIDVDIPEGMQLCDLLARFNVPQDDSSVIVLNGLTMPLSTVLKDGDEVSAFSAVAGG